MKLHIAGTGSIKQDLNILLVTAYRSFSLAPAYFYEIAFKNRMNHTSLAIYLRHYPRFLHEVDYSFIRDVLVVKPDVIAFSCFFWNYADNIQLAELAKSLNDKIYIIMGGPQTGDFDHAKKILDDNECLDAVLCGEADYTFPQFIASIAEGSKLDDIPGLVHRVKNIIKTGKENYQVADLADLPPIYNSSSEYVLSNYNRYNALPLETIRGCRSTCSFCHYCTNTLRFMPLKKVESEIAFLCKNEAKYVRVCDSHFGGSRARAIELFDMIKHYNRHDTAFYFYPDPDHVDDDYLRAARKANCHVISIGIETLDDNVNRLISRKVSTKKSLNALSLMKRENINPQVDLIFGLPEQTLQSFVYDIVSLRMIGSNNILFSPLMLFPGTRLNKEYGDQGLTILDTPQNFAFSKSMFGQDYALAYRVIDLHTILNNIPRTEYYIYNNCLGGKGYKKFLEQIFALDVIASGSEIDQLAERFTMTAQFIINECSDLGLSVKKLFNKIFNIVFNSDSNIDEIIKFDLYNYAMKKRHEEIKEDILGLNFDNFAFSWDDIDLKKFRLRENCWLEIFHCPPGLLKIPISNIMDSGDAAYCLFICDCNSSHIISRKEYEFLSDIQNPAKELNLIYATQFIKEQILKWSNAGALAPV